MMRHAHRPRIWSDESGAAAAEYAILVAFVASAIALAVSQFELPSYYDALTVRLLALIK